jgi:FixJ family two-component response regulator
LGIISATASVILHVDPGEPRLDSFLADRPKQIGSLLNISPKTVDTYRASILRKIGVESVVYLVKLAIKWKLS